MNIFLLTKVWFEQQANNPNCKSGHTALYFYILDLANRLQWKAQFGLPSLQAQDTLKIASWKKYHDLLNDLEQFGFIKIVEKSKNQYTSTQISLVYAYVKNAEPHIEAGIEAHIEPRIEASTSYNKVNTIKTFKDDKDSAHDFSFSNPDEKYSIDLTDENSKEYKEAYDDAVEYLRSLTDAERDMIKKDLGLKQPYVYRVRATGKYRSFTQFVYQSYILMNGVREHMNIYPSINEKTFYEKLREFLTLKVAGDEYKNYNNISTFKSHFANWLKLNLKK